MGGGAALIAAFFYLLPSGAEVATQRSFMTAIALLAVMVDRSGRSPAQSRAHGARRDAACSEAVMHPSLQMSFVATLALAIRVRSWR